MIPSVGSGPFLRKHVGQYVRGISNVRTNFSQKCRLSMNNASYRKEFGSRSLRPPWLTDPLSPSEHNKTFSDTFSSKSIAKNLESSINRLTEAIQRDKENDSNRSSTEVNVIKSEKLHVALIGPVDSGKSTFFNMLANESKAYYHLTTTGEATTHDVIEGNARFHDIEFIAIDTPGTIDSSSKANLVRALSGADIAIFMVSAYTPPGKAEFHFSNVLHSMRIPTVLVVNKIDARRELCKEKLSYKELGCGDPVFVSLKKNTGLDDLYSAVLPILEIWKVKQRMNDANLEEAAGQGDQRAIGLVHQRNSLDRYIRVAILGLPNSGKSSLLNRIVGCKLAHESTLAYSTRDPIEIKLTYNGKKIKLVDTPGFARVKECRGNPAADMLWRSTRSVLRFSNVCMIVFDASKGCPGKGDMILAHRCIEEGKAFMFVANKWDLVNDGVSIAEAIDYKMKKQLHEVKYCSAVAVSAYSGLNLLLLLDHTLRLFEIWNKLISSGRLTQFWKRIEKSISLPRHVSRVRRLVQVNVRPPAFVIHLQTRNELKRLPYSYENMLRNHLVEEFGFHGVPLRIFQEVKDSYKDFF